MSNRRKKKKKKKNYKKKALIIISILVTFSILAIAIYGINLVTKVSHIPNPPKDELDYQVRGIDVSSYQGVIDWPKLSNQGIAFAFIKATEGSNHIDKYFEKNWEEASKTHLRIGAYHFMSFETAGKDQASNFIRKVNKVDNMLPPTVDVEFYGDFIQNNPSQESVHNILSPLLQELEKEYGQKPLIYTNTHIYENYIEGNYDNDIWIADPTLTQPLSSGNQWTFCQYSFEGVLEGYKGEIKHIDLNVFNGSKLDFVRY